MTGKLPETASVAHESQGGKLFAPAAERNAAALCDLLRDHAPKRGRALELASGTGQHVVDFARACPGLIWHPSEVSAERRASIDAYRAEAALPNLRPARFLDATRAGWGAAHAGMSLIVLVNLLHLIPTPQAITVVAEAVSALGPDGRFLIYGPFTRSGAFTSDGDARFHAQLSGADPAIGYKDDAQVEDWLRQVGAARLHRVEMPANNLAFIAAR
ncbi:MAG: DUF938 domain-containing protein [Pseudomonadota bacterium]